LKKRDAFNRMMQDCRDGHIESIITKSVSRFGRNTLDCLNSTRELKALGIDVFFEKENIHTMQSEGELLLSLISAVSQNESYTQSENVKWGIRRKYERGNIKSIPSGKFLGFDKDGNGNFVINEAQAKIVRRIYREFLDGYGTYQIAARLTRENVPMAHGGKEWCASHIRKVLVNEKMKGDTLFQKTFNADPLTKHRVKNNGELPQLYLEDTHPGIVDKNTWECVQMEFSRQAQYCEEHYISKFYNNSRYYPLSSKITCGSCGNTFMQLESSRMEDGSRRYWRCSSFNGMNGKVIEGHTHTMPGPYTKPFDGSKAARYRAKHRKPPVIRDMLCTDIPIDTGVPERAFISVWNRLVKGYKRYLSVWQKTIAGNDVLNAYRAKELMRLITETGCIERIPDELMLKTLDHIEIGVDGLEVVFLAGTRIKI